MPVLDPMPLYDWYGANTSIFLVLNGLRADWLDPVMVAVSAIGHPRMYPLHAAWVMCVAWRRPEVLPLRNVVILALAFVLVSMLIVPILKDVFDLPRPATALRDGVRVLGEVDPAHSFPSGHAAFATVLAVSLAPGAGRRMRVALGVFATLVCMSRVWVGAHFPADVVWGALIAAAAVTALRLCLRPFARRTSA